MGVNQVVMRGDGAAEPTFDVLPNPRSKNPLTFENDASGVHVPSFGSSDIVLLSSFAAEHGFRIVRFSLADPYMSAIPDDERERVSDFLVTCLAEAGPNGVREMLKRDFRGYLVTAVDLEAEANMDRVSLRRHGVTVGTAIDHQPGKSVLIQLLQDAWKAIRFA